jgi:hypothetical protein
MYLLDNNNKSWRVGFGWVAIARWRLGSRRSGWAGGVLYSYSVAAFASPLCLWVPWVPYLAVLWAFEGPGFGFVTKSKPNNPRLRLLRAGHCRDASMSAQSASVGIPVAKCCLHISESEPHTQLPGPAAGATAARQPRVHQVHAAAPRLLPDLTGFRNRGKNRKAVHCY